MKIARVFVSGFVQGVGFRQFIKKNASKLGLSGWVRNRSDNRVEMVFHGPKEKIEQMTLLCKKGPFLSEVKNVEILWEENHKDISYKTFEIV